MYASAAHIDFLIHCVTAQNPASRETVIPKCYFTICNWLMGDIWGK